MRVARFALGLVVALVVALSAGTAGALDEGRWAGSLQEARLSAIKQRKPVLIVLLAADEAASKTLERRLESATSLQPLLDGFSCVKLDKDKHPDLVKQYRMPNFPALLVTTGGGRPIKLVVGGLSLGKCRSQMKEALAKHAKLLDPTQNIPKTRPKSVAPRPGRVRPHVSSCPVECEFCEPAVDKALDWLASRQRPRGSWRKLDAETQTKTEKGERLTRSIDHVDVALTSLAGLALMADGSTAETGRYKAQVSRALAFVRGAVREDGAIAGGRATDWVESVHATFETSLGAMFLAEAYATRPDRGLREKLERIAAALSEAQDPRTGGWGYSFDAKEHPAHSRTGWRLLATTHCCMTALNYIQGAGIDVDEEVLARGVAYLRSCVGKDGSFAYRSELRWGNGYPGATAGALFAISRTGLVEAAELEGWRTRQRHTYRDIEGFGEHWWFFLLYTGLAANDRGAGFWQECHTHFRETLLENQGENGSWADPDDKAGRVFATAIAALFMQLGRGNLPLSSARSGDRGIAPAVAPRYLKPPNPLSRVKVFERDGGYLADLIVSVDGPTDDAYFDRLRASVLGANRLLFDVTDGQMQLHRVELVPGGKRADEADVLVTTKFYEDPNVPRGGAHGITMVSRRTEVRGSRERKRPRIGEWVKLPYYLGGGEEPVPWQNHGLVRVFAHELCHYLLGVQDEYGVGGTYCACIVGDRATTELCRDGHHTDDRRELSCWSQAKTLYPDLREPLVPDPGPWDPPLPIVVVSD